MSLITRNQITITSVLDGEQGDPGVQGPQGNSLYTWIAFASDLVGTNISLTYSSGLHTHIGRCENMDKKTPDLTEPTLFEWTPFYANLIAEDIEIISGGAIRCGYDEGGGEPDSGAGFYLGPEGLKAVGGRFSGEVQATSGVFQNSLVYGRLIHDSLETVEQQAGTTIGAVSTAQSLWSELGFYNAFGVSDSPTLQAITANSWKGKTPIYATKRNNSRVTLLSQTSLSEEYDNSIFMSYGTGDIFLGTYQIPTSGTKRAKLKLFLDEGQYAGIRFNYITFKVSLNSQYGPLIHSETWTNSSFNSDPTIEFNVNTGDTLYFWAEYDCTESFGSHDLGIYINNRYLYTALYTGLVFKYSDNSISLAVGISNSVFSDDSWSSSSPSFSTANILSRRKGDALIDSIGLSGTSFIDCVSGSITINGNTYAISRIRKLTNSVEVISGTTTYVISRFIEGSASGAYTSLSTTSIVPVSQSAGVQCKTLSPKTNNTYDVGSSGNYFREIYGGKVYGAVGNDIADSIETPEGWSFGYAHIVDGVYFGIPSDTASFTAGIEGSGKMPRVIAGFALVYTDKIYQPGTKLTFNKKGLLIQKKWYQFKKPTIARFHITPGVEIWNNAEVLDRNIVQVVY
jgi:hypothetical protein